MIRKSTHDKRGSASQWWWEIGATRYVEWAWEMQNEPLYGVVAAGILPLLTGSWYRMLLVHPVLEKAGL